MSAFPGQGSLDADVSLFGDEWMKDPWNTITLGGVMLPGIVEVSGKGVGHDLDIKKAPGGVGWTLTDLGEKPPEFSLKLMMWTQKQWNGWQDAKEQLQPLIRVASKLKAVAVKHPAINDLGVFNAYVDTISPPRHNGGKVEIEISLVGYKPPTPNVNASTTIKSSKASQPSRYGLTVNTATQQTVAISLGEAVLDGLVPPSADPVSLAP